MALYEYDADFLMTTYKVQMCGRADNHDWARCPYAHEKEKARRRDPRRFAYASAPCPDAMPGGVCPRADACGYTHNVQEYWLHPSRFKTQMCKNGAQCTRPLCFFAHRAHELRPAGGGAPSAASAAALAAADPAPRPRADPTGAASAAAAAAAAAPHALFGAIGGAGADAAPPQLLPLGEQFGAAATAAAPSPAGLQPGQLVVGPNGAIFRVVPAGHALLAAQAQQQHAQQRLLLELQQQQQRQQAAAADAACAPPPPPPGLCVTPRVASDTSTASGWSATVAGAHDVGASLHVPLGVAPASAGAGAGGASGLYALAGAAASGGAGAPPQLLQMLQQQLLQQAHASQPRAAPADPAAALAAFQLSLSGPQFM